MIIYRKEDFIQVSYRSKLNYIIFDWTNFFVTLEDIQDLHQKALKTAKEKNCFYYVAETSKVNTILRPEVIKWWGDIWVPELAEAGIKGIVTVVPTSVISTLSTHSWQSRVVNSITMKNVKTLQEAEAYIKKLSLRA